MEDVITLSFGSVFGIMEFLGLYPPEKPPKIYKLRSYLLYFFLMIIVLVFIYIRLILTQSFNMSTFYSLIFGQNVFMTCLKMLPFLLRGVKIKKCINFFADSRFIPRDEEPKKLLEFCVKVCKTTCYLFLAMLALCSVFWYIPVLLTHGKLPLELWLPYDYLSNKLVFWITFFYLAQGTFYCVFSTVTIDCTIATLSFHATTQLKILKYNLKNLDKFIPEIQDEDNTTITLEQAKAVLLSCIKLHKDIIYFVAEFEDCFSWSILCQMAGSALSVCICCLTITFVRPFSQDYITCVTYAIIIMCQIFFYCLFGTLLYEENNTFMDVVCEGPWYRYDTRIRKMIFIIMERSKRAMFITVGKVVPLSFSVFVSIMKMSYSLLAVMQQFGK